MQNIRCPGVKVLRNRLTPRPPKWYNFPAVFPRVCADVTTIRSAKFMTKSADIIRRPY